MKGHIVVRSLAAGAASLLVLATAGAGVAGAAPYAYAAGIDGGVAQFDIGGGGLVALTPAAVAGGSVTSLPNQPNRPAVSPDARSVYVAMPADDAVRQYDIGADGTLTPKPSAAVAAGDEPIAVAVSPDGASAYVADYGDGTISEYDVLAGGTLSPKATIPAGANPVEVVVTPDGRHAYAVNSGATTISLYDVGPGGALVARGTATAAPLAHNPTGMVISPDGRRAYVAAADVLVYDVGADGSLAARGPAATPAGHVFAGGDLVMSPDGDDLYANDGAAPGATRAGISRFAIGADGAATWVSHLDAADTTLQLAMAPDGRSLYADADSFSGRIDQFDRAAGGTLTAKTPNRVTPPAGAMGLAVTPSSDVSLTGTADRADVTAGRTVTYTFTAANDGSPATGVTVTDPLPAGVTLVSASASQGTCTGSGTVTCSLGPLASGGDATVTISVRAVQPGTVTNTASVDADQPDPSAANDSASVGVAVASAPLATTSDASALTPDGATLNGVVVPNGRATAYRFEYGVGDALDHRVPAGPGDAGAGVDGVAVAQRIAGLAPSTRYSFRLVATDADGASAVGAVRSFTTPARPVPAVDLGLTGRGPSAAVRVGRTGTFSFTVTDGSATDAATGVVILVPLPGGARLAAGGLSRGCAAIGDGSAVSCAVGTVGPGGSATVSVPLTPAQAGDLRVTGIAAGAQPDPDAADDVATVAATVVPPPPSVSVRGALRLSGRTVRAVLACKSPSGRRCRGTAKLTAGHRAAGAHRYSVAAGKRATVKIRLSRRTLALLAHRHRVRVKLTVRPKGGGAVRHRRAVLRRRGQPGGAGARRSLA